MNTQQYLAALKKLGLSPAAKLTGRCLGLSVRQLQRIAHGEAPVPQSVALLLAIYLQRGVPSVLKQRA